MPGKFIKIVVGVVFVSGLFSCSQRGNKQIADSEFSGSESCIECHERFYDLWSPSFHGKAMQPVEAAFVKENGLPDSEFIAADSLYYQIVTKDSSMIMYEKEGDELVNTYKIAWSLGGRNVFTFLTPLDKGKLQTIPLAYDMNRKTWFNYPESAVRHFMDEEIEDEPLPWKDAMYTFNTGCYSCHISQLSTNFDLTTETYQTTWREAGINCETCHGPATEHVKLFRNAKEGEEFEDIKLIVTSTFTQEQHNSSCAPCHAKMRPITPSYMPGDKFFDNYDLTTLEDRDFYPDGRDLGENYTMTGWMMNKCVTESDMHCVTCHTSSGRNRFSDNPNQACASCHSDKTSNPEAHHMHKAEDDLACISCHMPKREFVGHFLRSDHSFRPPMPEATIKFGSPNACNQCHNDKSPEWANKIVKKRPNGDYQEETLKWAQLIKEARETDWNNLDEMLDIISNDKYNEVVVTSFVRLLDNCYEDKKWPVLIDAMANNKSPLVRSAAATGMLNNTSEVVKNALIKACTDDVRLVRVSAALPLASFPKESLSATDAEVVAKATSEYMTSLVARPDDWSSHYNLGIFHQNQGDAQKALDSYETAARLYPESGIPLINSSVLYSYIGNHAKAEENLRKVITYDPDNEAANLNLGLLLAEQGRLAEAQKALKAALDANPEGQYVAAYNLSVITAQNGNIADAVKYAEIAANAQPDDPKYAYTLAYYQMESGKKAEAIKTLKGIIKSHPEYLTATSYLADIYLRDGNKSAALKLYQDALQVEGISEQDRATLLQSVNMLQQSM